MLQQTANKVPPLSEKIREVDALEEQDEEAEEDQFVVSTDEDSQEHGSTHLEHEVGEGSANAASSGAWVVTVRNSYGALAEGELSLVEGQHVTVMSSEEDDWWLGRVGAQVGIFPSSHVS